VGEAAAATVFRIIEMQGLSAPGDSASVKWTGNRKSAEGAELSADFVRFGWERSKWA
jgi:hypothetical protein